jgi:hypothetical protein
VLPYRCFNTGCHVLGHYFFRKVTIKGNSSQASVSINSASSPPFIAGVFPLLYSATKLQLVLTILSPLRALSSRVEVWKSFKDEIDVFPCCGHFRKIDPLDQSLDNWFIVMRNHSSVKQVFWVHQNVSFTVHQW